MNQTKIILQKNFYLFIENREMPTISNHSFFFNSLKLLSF
jgi:hypothetical protein